MLIPPSSGSLSILGLDAVKNPLNVRHKIGVVLQQPSYEPTLTVEKSLDKYGMMWNVPQIKRKKRMEQLLQDFDLVEIRKKKKMKIYQLDNEDEYKLLVNLCMIWNYYFWMNQLLD